MTLLAREDKSVMARIYLFMTRGRKITAFTRLWSSTQMNFYKSAQTDTYGEAIFTISNPFLLKLWSIKKHQVSNFCQA